jgi:hypothetical protein
MRGEADTTGDGNIDLWVRIADDGETLLEVARDTSNDGQVLEIREDSTGGGVPDIWSTFSPVGVLERVTYDTDGTGQADRWLNYGVDGELISIQTDTDGDGVPDEIKTPPR